MSDKLIMNEYLVAFVDLLGFGKKVLAVKTDDELQKIHETVQFVHETFGKKPKDPHEESERNVSKRFILSLSDSLVIATALISPVSKIMGTFDNWCDEVHNLGMNQAICAANGIFLRGGLSKGQFYFADDILLSQAQVNAYKIESETANYPVICLDESAYSFFISHQDNRNYAEEINPTKRLFMTYSPKAGEHKYCIDYMRIGIGAAYDEFTWTDKNEWREAPPDLRDKVREDIAIRNSKKFITHHKKAVENELNINSVNPDPRVREKYQWLQKYHNKAAQEFFPNDSDCLI
jgi:hypothetical protein